MRAGGQPKQSRREPESAGAQCTSHRIQILPGRKNAIRPDQSADPEQQRVEGGEIDGCQGSQEDPSRQQFIGTAKFGIEKPAKKLPLECAGQTPVSLGCHQPQAPRINLFRSPCAEAFRETFEPVPEKHDPAIPFWIFHCYKSS